MCAERHAKVKKPQGNVLLLSLFILSAVLLAATALGSIVVRALRNAAAGGSSTVAYYAAESGAERALWELRKQQVEVGALPAQLSYPGGVTAVRTVEGSGTTTFIPRIKQNDTYELALFVPGATPPAGGVSRLVVRWSADCGASSVIEFQNVTWTPGAGWAPGVTQFRYGWSEQPVSLTLNNPGTNSYRLRVRPERCDAEDVRIDAFDSSGNAVALPDRVTVVSTGSFAGTKQAVQVTVPLYSPLSGLFDFALFSECSIDKGGTVDCPGDATPVPPPPPPTNTNTNTNTNQPPPPPPSGGGCPLPNDPYVCGDGCTNPWYEYCDNGWMNGQAYQCNHSCTGYCGATPC